MRSRGKMLYGLSFGLLLACAGILYAQGSSSRSLIVNGKPAGTVVQFGGHSYIDLETVAQFTNGTITIEANRVLLSIAGLEAGPAPESRPAAPPPPPAGLSREFARQAIAELAEMREWRGAIGTILAYGVPVVGTWPQDYQDRVGADLNQLAVAATTASDRDALQLLSNEFGNLARWADATVATRNSLNATKTVSPNAMQNDPDLKKISDCSQFLSSMLVSGTFADDPSCH
ncbi:MAG: hypothetical protein LAO08_11110 [Acidobacteriia bacterium]|nr:hypothetical protein [Terriglobia bacterium]